MSNISAFLKPTRGKVLLAVLIAILNVTLGWYSASAVACTMNCPKPNAFQKLTAFTIYPIGIVFFIGEVFEELTFMPDLLLEILYPLCLIATLGLFWYLLSCLVMMIVKRSGN